MFKIIDNPLIKHKLAQLRDRNTRRFMFGKLAEDICLLSLPEVMKDLEIRGSSVETPIGTAGTEILDEEISIISILRAGLGMKAALDIVPNSIGIFLGMKRDEETLKPEWYYRKNLGYVENRTVLVLDPMLATGGTMVEAVKLIKEYDPNRIKVLCILASRHGADNFCGVHPDVELFVTSVDDELSEEGFICPGLGDAGDRLFGTEGHDR